MKLLFQSNGVVHIIVAVLGLLLGGCKAQRSTAELNTARSAFLSLRFPVGIDGEAALLYGPDYVFIGRLELSDEELQGFIKDNAIEISNDAEEVEIIYLRMESLRNNFTGFPAQWWGKSEQGYASGQIAGVSFLFCNSENNNVVYLMRFDS